MAISTNPHAQKSRKSLWTSPSIYGGTLLLCVALYVAFVLLTCYESTREFEQRDREQQAVKNREDDRRTVEQLGGWELAIRSVYVSPIRRGEKAQLCYDVANVKPVTLDNFPNHRYYKKAQAKLRRAQRKSSSPSEQELPAAA